MTLLCAHAVERLSELKYHDSMVLERTDDDTAEWQRYLEGEIGISGYRMTLRFFNVNSVSLLKNGTCIKPRAQSGASYIPAYDLCHTDEVTFIVH